MQQRLQGFPYTLLENTTVLFEVFLAIPPFHDEIHFDYNEKGIEHCIADWAGDLIKETSCLFQYFKLGSSVFGSSFLGVVRCHRLAFTIAFG